MSYTEITAAQLARIDAICLDYEKRLRGGEDVDLERWLTSAPELPQELLREELQAVREELIQSPAVGAPDEPTFPPFASGGGSPPFSRGGSRADDLELPQRPPRSPLRDDGEAIFHVGRELGPYRIESLLGRGGMGRVYQGRDQRLDRPVAIKVLADDWAQHPERVERFERESKAVAALRHSNIVSLYDVGSHAGCPYAVMELLDGETLREHLQRGRMTPLATCQVGRQVASALAAAHAGGIVHRDLKPENLILSSAASASTGEAGPNVKLLDFGLSRSDDGVAMAERDQTATGVVMGTAGYMAPEQARGEKATPAADLFSLGCVLYECLYGHRAFPGKTVAESIGRVLYESPPIDAERAAEAPALAAVIDACLAKSIDRRPDSAPAVAHRLGEIEVRLKGVSRLGEASGATTHPPAQPGRLPAAARPPGSLSPGDKGDLLDRRRWLELIAGAAAGGVLVSTLPGAWGPRFAAIDSIAVLPWYHLGGESGQPLGSRKLVDEERIAAMLVNELAKLPTLNVRPFRPMTAAPSPEATDKQQLRALADELGVGGLVLVEVSGEGPRREVNLQLVDPHNGEVLWGERFAYTDQPSSLLARTDTAAILAEKVGQQVAALKRTGRTENEDAFFCLVRGKARFDPDSEAGMRSAIDCFQHARTLDPAFVDAHAGLALTTLALAGRTAGMESQRLVAQAREAISDAMALTTEGAPISREPLVNLANAILLWQADHQFVEADPFFQAALQSLPNYWQTHHEYAFYQAALGSVKATDWAQRAVMLNPMSVSVRLDEARLGWFQGDAEGALRKAASILRDDPRQGLAKGLAIDVYEQQGAYREAAALLGEAADRPWDRTGYLDAREASLERLPYGPFGPTLNRAIWEARAERVDEVRLQQVVDQQPPLLVLLLAAHPALTTARSFAAAQSVLPGSRPAAPG